MAWDPTARKAPQWVEIESSRDDAGVAQGAVQCTPWDAGKRLAYENRMVSQAIRIDFDDQGGKIRSVLPGELRRLAVQLTVTDARGFGPGADFTSAAWIDTLDPDVFEEVVEAAVKVQPLPTGGVKRPADRQAAQVESGPPVDEDDEDAEEGDGQEEDPTRTPSTPAE